MLTTHLISLSLATMMLANDAKIPAPELQTEDAIPLNGFVIDVDRSDFVSRHDDGSVLIDAPTGTSAVVPLGEFPIEGMKSRTYALQLTVDHAIGSQPAYFEMWTILDDGRRFFSKTLATSGPMKRLAGNDEGRGVAIPASLAGSTVNAVSAELSLIMPSGGTVTIREGGLVDLPGGFGTLGQLAGGPRPWMPFWFGAVLGSIVGVVGGCLGAFYTYSYCSGKLWELMQFFPTAFCIFSVLLLTVGIVAVAVKQPYHVWYPMVLIGGLGAVIAPTLPWQLKWLFPKDAVSYEDRQMQAMDANV